MRLIVRGPQKYNDLKFVTKILDRYTAPAKDIVLISDLRIDEESSFRPSHFPLAEDWLRLRWLRWRGMVGGDYMGDLNKFCTVIHYSAPFRGDKQWTQGVKRKRLQMLDDATHMVAFWDVGGMDYETEAFIRLAKLKDFKTKVVLI